MVYYICKEEKDWNVIDAYMDEKLSRATFVKATDKDFE